MCGRYGFYHVDEFSDRFGVNIDVKELKPNYNAAPGQYLPVIRQTEKGRVLEVMKWGLVPVWAKDINMGYKMINARSESVFEKSSWKGSVRHHRCLVPANFFYEWDKVMSDGKTVKQPYLIKPDEQELFSFAGLFSTWHDVNGNELWSYSIVTEAADEDMKKLHDRQPCILAPEDEDLWLDPSVQDRLTIEAVLHRQQSEKLIMVEASRDVNSVKNNDERLILPINSQ